MNKFFFGTLGVLILLIASGYTINGNFIERNVYHAAPRNAGGAAPGMTGAPNESNCTQCHYGSIEDGANENVLTILDGLTPVSSYIPGHQYNVNLLMSSNPVKRGFQATALTISNTMAGSFTGQAGNTSINGGVKKYANHTSTSNTSATAPSWTWTWTAPASGSGVVRFYVATNKTNNNGNDNGDMIYLSTHAIQEASNSVEEGGLLDIEIKSISAASIEIELPSQSTTLGALTIYDQTGKIIVLESNPKPIGNNMSLERPFSMSKGIFYISMIINNRIVVKKVLL